jgi:hypothetical protein
VCTAGKPIDCDDDNPCTDDTCSPTEGCVHVNNDAPCDDHNACTKNESCHDGACTAGEEDNPCDNGDPCDGVEICDAKTGSCRAGHPPNCNDGDACTRNTCNAQASSDPHGCFFPHVSNYAECRASTGFTLLDRLLGSLQDRMQLASADALGGAKMTRRLERLVGSARQQLTIKPPRRGLQRASARLKAYRRLLTHNAARMDANVVADLSRILNDAMAKFDADKRGL